jgi:hypothetical protein
MAGGAAAAGDAEKIAAAGWLALSGRLRALYADQQCDKARHEQDKPAQADRDAALAPCHLPPDAPAGTPLVKL